MLKQIPNIITVLRILLTPVFALFYLSADGPKRWMFPIALAVLAVIMLSDLLDGWLARRFSLQSKLGAVLDPIADKLAQVVICICLFLKDIAPLWFIVALIVKELSMFILGLACIRCKVEIQPARWYGKAATFIFYVVICFNLVFPFFVLEHPTLRLCGFILAVFCAYFAFVNYIIIHLQVWRRQKAEQAEAAKRGDTISG